MKINLAILFAVLTLPFTASANLLQNGDFESPGGAPIRAQITGNFVTNWSHGGTGFEIYESNGQDGINAESGNYYVSWGHLGTTGGTLSQTFGTVAGTQYAVTYFLTQQQGSDPAQSVTVEAFDGLSLLNSVTENITGVDGAWFAGNVLTFTATSASTTLTFLDSTPVGGGSAANWALDNVSVDLAAPVPSPAPEPATLALLGAGIAGLGFARRRKA